MGSSYVLYRGPDFTRVVLCLGGIGISYPMDTRGWAEQPRRPGQRLSHWEIRCLGVAESFFQVLRAWLEDDGVRQTGVVTMQVQVLDGQCRIFVARYMCAKGKWMQDMRSKIRSWHFHKYIPAE